MQRVGRIPRRLKALVASLIVLAAGLTWITSTPEPAAAAPALDVSVSAPASVLIGQAATITVSAANSTGTPGYNTGIAIELPQGVSALVGTGLDYTTLADTPVAGATTIWFGNVNDSQPASTVTVSLDVTADPVTFPVGSTFGITANAYTSSLPRQVPQSDGTGSTGSGTGSAAVDVTAITIEKSEPSPEAELLRGVHDHDTVYTLTVENNPTNPTTAVLVDDYLPAGLELLGCGTVDNTLDAPTFGGNNVEYPGAPRLDVSTADLTVDCPTPTLVETVQLDPDGTGPLPDAVYTHVQWSLGAFATGQTQLVTYAAGVPIRENTLTWSGATPATSGAQTANLDNNDGPETSDEQVLANHAVVTGTYQGPLTSGASNPVGDSDTHQVTAEDVRLLKTAGPTSVTQLTDSVWTLTVASSEYRTVDNLDITDTLPDGHCPLDTVNHDTSDPGGECDPTGSNPSIPYTTVTENSDGTWTLFWDDVASLGTSDTVVLTFPSKVRTYYQESGSDDTPVVTSDGFVNTATLTGDDHLVAGIPADEADGTPDPDASSATQAATGPILDKTVSVPSAPGAPLDCATASYVDADDLASAPFAYRPGDIVCYTLRVDIPANLTFKDALVTDFLPAGVTLLSFSGETPASDVPDFAGPLDFTDGTAAAVGDTDLAFELGTTVTGGHRYLPISTVARTWEVRFIAEFTGAPTGSGSSLEKANLMKLTTQNSAGAAISLRDQATFIAVEPELTIAKSTPSSAVVGGDTAPFTVTVANVGQSTPTAGYARAEGITVTDDLPAPFTCAEVTLDVVAGASGSCTGSRITWTVTGLDGGASIDLTYDLAIPDSIAPDQDGDQAGGLDPGYTNTATVVSFSQTTNDAGTTTYTPGTTATETLTTRAVPLAKLQQSSVTEAGNSANGALAGTDEQATIGETVDYEVSVDIPAGTTVHDAVFDDVLPAGMTASAISGSFDDDISDGNPAVALPTAGFAFNGSNPLQVDFPTAFTNPAGSGDARVTVTFTASVDDVVGNSAGTNLDNQGRLRFQPTSGGGPGTEQTELSAARRTVVVEPDPTIVKDDDDPDDVVVAGQTVGYTLTVTNPVASTTSVAHELTVVDTIPTRIEPVLPIADGGVWSPGARTITWTSGTTPALASLDPGAGPIVLAYDATLANPVPAGGPIDNSATVTASSLTGTVAGERTTYSDTSTRSLAVEQVTLTKALSPDTGPYTIGETVEFAIVDTVPRDVIAFDHVITDHLPDGLVHDGISTVTYGPGCSVTGTETFFTTAAADGGTDLALFVGDVSGVGAACVIDVTVTTHVDGAYDGSGTPAAGQPVVSGDLLVNSARANWMQTDTMGDPTVVGDLPTTWDGQTTPATVTVTVSEPQIVIDKDVTTVSGCDAVHAADGGSDDDACTIQPGHGSLTYTLTVRNAGTEPAHDLVVVDQPDAELTNIVPVTGSGSVTDGWTGGDPDLAWAIPGPVAPGGSIALTYSADPVAPALLPDGAVATNTADVTTYYGLDSVTRAGVSGERTYGTTFGPVTADQVDLTIEFPQLTVAKTVADGSELGEARVGEPFGWRLTVANGATVADAVAVDVTDTLPVNWAYDTGSAQLCDPGCAGIGDPTVTGTEASGLDLAWTDVTNLAAGSSAQIRFTATPSATVLTTPGVGGTVDHLNTASATADDASGASGNSSGPYAATPDQATARLYEADVRLDKEIVTAGPYLAGQTVTYRVTVTNDGPDAATDVVVDDVLDGGDLIYAATQSVDGSYDSGTGRWTLPASVANAASAVLELQAVIDHAGTITNSAQVVEATRHDPDSTPGNGAGSEDDQDQVSIVVGTASIGSTVWFDGDGGGGDETGRGLEPGIGSVTVLLSSRGNDDTYGTADDFWGPDGVSGGVDDISVTSTSTDSSGNYAFAGLPAGTYRVAVDPASLPGGATAWTQTYDDGAPLDHSSGDIVLASAGDSYLDADFSYTGSGSIGDRIWWDVDRSGDGTFDGSPAPGGQDQPLAGIPIDLRWAGTDGVLDSGDDVTWSATTDATGTYGFAQLPPGLFRVVVGTGSAPFPDGLSDQTWDVQRTGPGGGDGDPQPTVEVTLGAGEARTDVDFSFAGLGTLGDRVWIDIDGDGVADSDEPGIGDVTVTLDWWGPDGIAGNGDDAAITTVTAADGSYLFTDLPAGGFTVTVDHLDADLPTELTPSSDLDGVGTPHTADVTLAADQDRLDVDFGYRGPGTLGDTVWLDLDGDGTLNGDEPGMPAVDLLVVWSGPDGVLGGGDDVTRTVTTGADGTWLLTGLPHGTYRVTVDTTTLVPGLTRTFDPDATDDGVTQRVIGVGDTSHLDADFGYQGSVSIGDEVWNDLDADGAIDGGGGELGLGGVQVVATNAGLDGVLGTSDDITVTTVTGGDGSYGVAGLPPGPTRVSIGAGAPADHAVVSELDGTTDGSWTGILADGEHRSDVDFGLRTDADLSVTKTHSGDLQVGGDAVYTITVTNNGPATATSVVVVDQLPAGLTYESANASGCSSAGATVTCTIGDLTPAGTVALSLTVAVGAGAAPSATNTVTVTSDTPDRDLSDNTASDPASAPLAEVRLTKNLLTDLRAGRQATYRISVVNNGPSAAPDLRVVDELPGPLSYVSASAGGWSCGAERQVVTCDRPGTLAPGETTTVDLVVLVSTGATGRVSNIASVTSTVPLTGSSVPIDSTSDPVAPRGTLPYTGFPVLLVALSGAVLVMLGGITGRSRRRP